MRLFQCAAIAALVLGFAVPAAAQMNPSNYTLSSLPNDAIEVPGEFAVEAVDGISDADLKQLKADYNLHSAASLDDERDKIEVGDVAPSDEDTVVDQLRHDPRVKFAERQHVFHATAWEPNDPLYDKQWNMKRVRAVESWSYSSGMGTVAAVIDTGVQESISDLQGVNFLKGYNFADDNEDTRDPLVLHGTHVTGTIVSVPNNRIGVVGGAYSTTILPVKALDDAGRGTMAGVALAIRYATDRGANTINMSLGASQSDNLTREAVEYALAKHVVVVAAAGNAGNDRPHYPSAYPGVISVSASDQNDHLAKFSSRGKQVVVSAPGVDVTQQVSDGSFRAFNGTSMASPHVNFLADQVVALGLRGEAVKDAITSNADKKPGEELLFGAGIINALSTVRHVYWSQFFWRTGALLLLAFGLKRRIRSVGGSPVKPNTFAMLLAGTGLVPALPLVGWLPKLGGLRMLGELVVRPFGCWDVLVNANVHNWLPLASVIPSGILLLIGFGSKTLRPIVGGFALGASALLTQLVIQNDGDWSWVFRGLIAANVAACLWIARTTLDSKLAPATTSPLN